MSSFFGGHGADEVHAGGSSDVRATPTADINGGLRLEYDANQGVFTTHRPSGQVKVGDSSVSAGWSRRKFETLELVLQPQ